MTLYISKIVDKSPFGAQLAIPRIRFDNMLQTYRLSWVIEMKNLSSPIFLKVGKKPSSVVLILETCEPQVSLTFQLWSSKILLFYFRAWIVVCTLKVQWDVVLKELFVCLKRKQDILIMSCNLTGWTFIFKDNTASPVVLEPLASLFMKHHILWRRIMLS